MDEHSATIKFLLEWVWAPIVVAMGWLLRRILRLEDTSKDAALARAVISANQMHMEKRFEEYDRKNEAAHNKIAERLDDHHRIVTGRIDETIKLLRNGNGK